jgi:hypothetical protein
LLATRLGSAKLWAGLFLRNARYDRSGNCYDIAVMEIVLVAEA